MTEDDNWRAPSESDLNISKLGDKQIAYFNFISHVINLASL